MSFKKSSLWQSAFRSHFGHIDQQERLQASLDRFRIKAATMANEIPAFAPGLTDHSVVHLDALWDIGSIISGNGITLNPTEAYVFGGAILLHDLANAVAAFPNGVEDLKGPEWNDLVYASYIDDTGHEPTAAEAAHPSTKYTSWILLQRLRQVHAEQAERLATLGFHRADGTGQRTHLIDDEDLRDQLGSLIGRIAHSHHWDLDRVVTEFAGPRGTPATLPAEWDIDALKIALLLRCADAAHLDSRRAPTFLRALRQPTGLSAQHWTFQNLLSRPKVVRHELVYSSSRPFRVDEQEAWWLAYETFRMVDQELTSCTAVLNAFRSFSFAAESVAGATSAKTLLRHLSTTGWTPLDARIHISDVIGLVEKFGGKQLYGSEPLVPLREIVANAADAIRARRQLESRSGDWGTIQVRIRVAGNDTWLEVEDNGIGMTERVLTGPLLDFGTSYWSSALARQEHPGLLSSGFSPTGRFGIGFFSIFDISSSIRVISRPYAGGKHETRVLEFGAGIGDRPIIRDASKAEHLRDGGSLVQLLLKSKPFEGLLKQFHTKGTSSLEALTTAVLRVAPTLDVAIQCQTSEGTIEACRPNDWKAIPLDNLISRASGNRAISQTGVSGDIFRGEDIIGRVRLTPGRQGGTITVGGLSTLRSAGYFDGVIIGDNPILSRSEAKSIVSPEEWRTFLLSHLSDLEHASYGGQRSAYAQILLDLGILPSNMLCFETTESFLNTEGLTAWLSQIDEGKTFRIALTDRVDISIPGDDTASVLLEDLEDWDWPDDLIICGDYSDWDNYGRGALIDDFPAQAEFPIGATTRFGITRIPNSLPAYILDIAAQAWGVTPDSVWNSYEIGNSNLGTFAFRGETEHVIIEALTVRRPETGD